MGVLFWANPAQSSLGDRLVDVMLLASLAKLINCNLHFEWVEAVFQRNHDGVQKYKSNENEFKTWDNVRYVDYLYENWSQYFELPSNIKINELNVTPNYVFHHYLGGCVSPHTFYERYVTSICSLEQFLKTFREVSSEFKPKDKLLNLLPNDIKPYLSVHLRRTDKIRMIEGQNQLQVCMTPDMVSELDNMTLDAINKVNDENLSIYFASDDEEVREFYNSKYKNHMSVKIDNHMEKTYVDLYLLMASKKIILSQVHSNFSVFASFINNAELIYLYEDCMITNEKFSLMDNFIYYKNIK